MKKYILAACAAALLTTANAGAQQILTGELSDDSTLAEFGCYYLEDCFVVKSGFTLTIEAGVTVLARSASALVVEPGARLVVNGTETDPVVFTSAEDPSERNPGDWYGIIIGGYSYYNDAPLSLGACTNVTAGGTTPGDNSGEIRYLQIHFAGGDTSLKLDNALTLNAVGNGTIIEHVQVTNSAANNLGIYGGTVDLSYLFSLDARQNDILISDGYTGRMQYLLAIRKDPNAYHTNPSNGILIQNNFGPAPYGGSPLTAPTISNATIIGPEACNEGPFGGDFQDGVKFTNNGAGSVYNAVIYGWPDHGLYIDGDQSVGHTATNSLNFSYNTLTDNAAAYGSSPWTVGCDASITSWITGSGSSCLENGNQISPTDLAYSETFCGDYCDEMFVPEFVINEGNTELEASDFTWPGSDIWFDDGVTYRGAIQEEDFYTAWSELCPGEAIYCAETKGRSVSEAQSLHIIPNPTSGSTDLLFDTENAGTASIQILDPIGGQALRNFLIRADKGTNRITLSLTDLRSGVYLVKITLPGGRVTTSRLFVL
jgi:hypothetical protein